MKRAIRSIQSYTSSYSRIGRRFETMRYQKEFLIGSAPAEEVIYRNLCLKCLLLVCREKRYKTSKSKLFSSLKISEF